MYVHGSPSSESGMNDLTEKENNIHRDRVSD